VRFLKFRFDQPKLKGEMDQFSEVFDLQLFHDLCPMGFHCICTDKESLGNLPVGIPLSDELKNLSLPVGE
jgi:hypothetical protein